MTLKRQTIWIPLWLLSAAASGGCAHQPPQPALSLTLTAADVTPAADAPAPTFAPLDPPKADGTAERDYLTRAVIRPLLAFSLGQEATIAAERARAAAIVEKVRGYEAEAEAHPSRRDAPSHLPDEREGKPWWRIW